MGRLCVGLVAFLGQFLLVLGPDPLQPQASHPLPTIVIDPGHGGNDEGAKSRGLKEKEVTLSIARLLGQQLSAMGYPVVFTRETDRYVALSERVHIANAAVRDGRSPLFISIHLNVDGQQATDGVETFYAKEKAASFGQGWMWVGFFSATTEPGDLLAASIQTAIIQSTETRNRGVKARNLYVVNNTRCPAVLVEAGFLSNPMEAQLLRNEDYCRRIAHSITEGILYYLATHPQQQN